MSDREQRGATRGRAGAVAAGGGPKRRLWPLLAALAAIAAIAIIVALVLGDGGSGKHQAAAPVATSTASPTTTSPAAVGSSTGQAAGPAAPGAAPSAAGLVGGGGVTAKPLGGNLASPGSIGAVLFAESGTALDANATAVVAMAAKTIQTRQVKTVLVTGYTDAVGNAPANDTLSLHRARAVVTALRERLSGSATRYVARAQGQAQPVASNRTPQGRQLNRRVVISIG